MSHRVEHFQYVVSDLVAAERFYTAVFGWQVRGRGHEVRADRSYDWIHIGTDDTYLAFRTPYNGEPFDEGMRGYKDNHVGIVTDDIKGVVARARQLGVPVRGGPGHPFRIRAYIRDFDNNEIELIQYLSEVPAERNDYTFDNPALAVPKIGGEGAAEGRKETT